MVSSTNFYSHGFYEAIAPVTDEGMLEQQVELAQQQRDWEAFLRLLNQSSNYRDFPCERWRQQAQIFIENVLLTVDEEQLPIALGLMLFYKIKDTALWAKAMALLQSKTVNRLKNNSNDEQQSQAWELERRQAWKVFVAAVEEKLLDGDLRHKAICWLCCLEALSGVAELSPPHHLIAFEYDLPNLFIAMIKTYGQELDNQTVAKIIKHLALLFRANDNRFSNATLASLRQIAAALSQRSLDADSKFLFLCMIILKLPTGDYPAVVRCAAEMLKSSKKEEKSYEKLLSTVKKLLYLCLSSVYSGQRAFVLNWFTSTQQRDILSKDERVLLLGAIINKQLSKACVKQNIGGIEKGIAFFNKYYKEGILRLDFMETAIVNHHTDAVLIDFILKGDVDAFQAAVKELFDRQLTLDFYRKNKRITCKELTEAQRHWIANYAFSSKDGTENNQSNGQLPIIFLQDSGKEGVKASYLPIDTVEERYLAHRVLFVGKIFSLGGNIESEVKAALVEVAMRLVGDLVKNNSNKSISLALLHASVLSHAGQVPDLLEKQLETYGKCLESFWFQRSQQQYKEAAYITKLYSKRKIPSKLLSQDRQISLVHEMIKRLPVEPFSSYFFLFDLICSIHNELYRNSPAAREEGCYLLLEAAFTLNPGEKELLDWIVAGIQLLKAALPIDRQISLVHRLIEQVPTDPLLSTYFFLLDFILAIHEDLYQNSWSQRIRGCLLLLERLPHFDFINPQRLERLLDAIKVIMAPTSVICEELCRFEEKRLIGDLCSFTISRLTTKIGDKLAKVKQESDKQAFVAPIAAFSLFCFEKGGFREQYLRWLGVIRLSLKPLFSHFKDAEWLQKIIAQLFVHEPQSEVEKQLRIKIMEEL